MKLDSSVVSVLLAPGGKIVLARLLVCAIMSV
jgi:hypothetical protein